MKHIHTQAFRYIVTTLLLFLGVQSSAMAAELYVETIPTMPREGEELIATLYVDTQGRQMNAIEGSISFSSNLDVIHVYYGSSFVPLWIKSPEVVGDTITYAGFMPRGFVGSLSSQWKGYRPGKLFTAVFIAREEGPAWIQVNRETTVLLHDGNATEDIVIVRDNDFEVKPSADNTQGEVPAAPLRWDDTEPPELFEPVVVRYPNKRFGGVWQLIFVAQDARSGVAYYEVKEGDSPFVRAESPYRLKNQNLTDDIVVRAVDQAGNVREVKVDKIQEREWYEYFEVRATLLGVLLGLIGVLLVIYRKRVHEKKS